MVYELDETDLRRMRKILESLVKPKLNAAGHEASRFDRLYDHLHFKGVSELSADI